MKLCRFKYIFCKFSEIGFLSPGKSTTTYLFSLIGSRSSKGAKAMCLLGYYPIQGWWWQQKTDQSRAFFDSLSLESHPSLDPSLRIALKWHIYSNLKACVDCWKLWNQFPISIITRLQILIHLFSSIRNCFPNTAPGTTEFIVVRIWHDKF